MSNTLYLPELREMLAADDAAGLREFCTALHPARTADFMDGLTPEEAWAVLKHAELPLRAEIFGYLGEDDQVAILELGDREEIAGLVTELPPDDRVDVLNEVKPEVVEELMPLIPKEERRDIQRLSAYPEHTAGAVMTTDFARLSEDLTVGETLKEIGRQAEELETIYYLYVVDREDHLRGLISARKLVLSIGKPDKRIGDLMETEIVTCHVAEDQEEVARKVARYDLLAIPVVDDEHRLVGIITHDDVIDVVREEAEEDAYRIAAVDPLDVGYMETGVFRLSWKRGMWLTILFVGAFFTALALDEYKDVIESLPWLVLFIPLVISTGGNSGSQSATLVITALSTGNVRLVDWWRVVARELAMGFVLGSFLGSIGYFAALFLAPSPTAALVIPVTILLVVLCGTMCGALLPLLFRRLGWDPALMSNPFVAGIIDLLGIVIYMTVALRILPSLS